MQRNTHIIFYHKARIKSRGFAIKKGQIRNEGYYLKRIKVFEDSKETFFKKSGCAGAKLGFYPIKPQLN